MWSEGKIKQTEKVNLLKHVLYSKSFYIIINLLKIIPSSKDYLINANDLHCYTQITIFCTGTCTH